MELHAEVEVEQRLERVCCGGLGEGTDGVTEEGRAGRLVQARISRCLQGRHLTFREDSHTPQPGPSSAHVVMVAL